MSIKTAREKSGLTRKEVSELLEIPYRTLQNWELGLREVPRWVEKLIIEKIENIHNNK